MAHFGTVDAMANLFSALTILFAVLVQREGKLINYALFGIFFGCAVASRINLVPLAALIVVAALMQMMPVFDSRVAPGERNRALLYHTGGLVLAGFLSLLCFRVFNPYAFNGPGFFGLSSEQPLACQHQCGAGDERGHRTTTRRIFNGWRGCLTFSRSTPWCCGAWGCRSASWPGSVGCGRAFALCAPKLRRMQNVLLVVWVLIYFGWLGRNWVTTMRYFLPIYPVLMVLAAWGLVWLVRYARAHLWRRRVFRAAAGRCRGFRAALVGDVHQHLSPSADARAGELLGLGTRPRRFRHDGQ